MYEYINGEIAELTPAYVVVEVAGVGYHIIISLQTYSEIEKLTHAKIFTHFIVREDAQILFGFATKPEREIFRLLIGVSGVGGNTARMVLSTYAPPEISSIISTGNATLLKNVKGLGLKTAQKIIVELRDKILGVSAPGVPAGSGIQPPSVDTAQYGEALAALQMLGFSKTPCEKVLAAIIKEQPSATVEELVRLALKKL